MKNLILTVMALFVFGFTSAQVKKTTTTTTKTDSIYTMQKTSPGMVKTDTLSNPHPKSTRKTQTTVKDTITTTTKPKNP